MECSEVASLADVLPLADAFAAAWVLLLAAALGAAAFVALTGRDAEAARALLSVAAVADLRRVVAGAALSSAAAAVLGFLPEMVRDDIGVDLLPAAEVRDFSGGEVAAAGLPLLASAALLSFSGDER